MKRSVSQCRFAILGRLGKRRALDGWIRSRRLRFVRLRSCAHIKLEIARRRGHGGWHVAWVNRQASAYMRMGRA